MGRKKIPQRERRLDKLLSFRITSETHEFLDKLVENSTSNSIGEVARSIITNKKVTLVHRDDSMKGTMEELAAIRKELRSIGVNINQIAKAFHTADTVNQKAYYVLTAAKQYEKVGEKVELLLHEISNLAARWLQ